MLVPLRHSRDIGPARCDTATRRRQNSKTVGLLGSATYMQSRPVST
jgi:hypothetical protein